MQTRPLRPFEQGAHLHVLDWTHDTARQRFQTAGAAQVKAAARAVVDASPDAGGLTLPSLQAAIEGELLKLYAVGHATVRSELDHQATRTPLAIGLSAEPYQLAVADARNPGRLIARAKLVAAAAAHAIWDAITRARLQGITDKRKLHQVGVDAGTSALGQAASHHAGGAINAGRHDAALGLIHGGGEGGPRAEIVGARYTSVLDKATCSECSAADTGELVPVGSPDWIPAPNPACLGGDRCRCIHIYQLASEVGDQAVAVAAGG